MTAKKECPRCGGVADEFRTGKGFPRPGALSRWDNRTTICSACGQQEAVAQLTGGRRAIDPVRGTVIWHDPPAQAWAEPLTPHSVRLTDTDWDDLCEIAASRGTTASALVRQLVTELRQLP